MYSSLRERKERIIVKEVNKVFKKFNSCSNLNDPIKKEHLHNVVYEIECPDCDKKYIGETGRRIEERFKEHAG